jgi:hypothetical protein
MDDRDLRPRHHRNPPPAERALDRLILSFAFAVGGLGVYGYAIQFWGIAAPFFR